MINIVINKINTQKYFLFFKQNIILPTININLLSVITFNINKYIQSITYFTNNRKKYYLSKKDKTA